MLPRRRQVEICFVSNVKDQLTSYASADETV